MNVPARPTTGLPALGTGVPTRALGSSSELDQTESRALAASASARSEVGKFRKGEPGGRDAEAAATSDRNECRACGLRTLIQPQAFPGLF